MEWEYIGECNGSNDLEEWLDKEGRGVERGLAMAAVLVGKVRDAVKRDTGCTCSAGIAHNKVSLLIIIVCDE